MNKKTFFLTIVAAMIVSVGGIIGYKVYENVAVKPVAKTAVDVPIEQLQAKPKESSQDFSVKSSNNINENSQLPGPANFSQYEQYSNADSTQYIDVVKGSGEEAVTGSTAYVLYKGYLTDGTLFDQSRVNEEGQITTFNFVLGSNQVIGGWEQGIYGMKAGGQRRLIVPSQFGYGETGQGSIPPNSMLIFDVELYKVDPPSNQ